MIGWPDFNLPPINLWNVPFQGFVSTVSFATCSNPPKKKAEIDVQSVLNRYLESRIAG